MDKIHVTKLVARAIVGVGTTTVSNSIIRNNVETVNLFQKISVGAASFVIGSMAAQAARQHTDAQIDEFVETWQQAFPKKTQTEEA